MKNGKRGLYRQTLIMFAAIIPLLFSCGNKKSEARYTNPLPMAFGDPYILKTSDGKYYMYGTNCTHKGYKAYESADLAEWKDLGFVFEKDENSWSVNDFWAPEVYEIDGKYYMLYSANWKVNPTNEHETYRIGVAVSDSPAGPFKDLLGRPIFDPGYPIIDGNLLLEDGKMYFYYSRCCYKHPVESEIADWAKEKGMFDEIEESWVYGVEIKPDFSGIIGEPVLLLRPPVSLDDKQAEWESRSVTSGEVNRRWTEGSFIIKNNDTYYMLYSANFFGDKHYAVGYATSKDPLGPFTKADNNPVLQKNVEQGGIVTGTGHCMVLTLDSAMYCVYHGRTAKTGDERLVFMDKMELTADGKLVVLGPTTELQTITSE